MGQQQHRGKLQRDVADHLLGRVRYAATALHPAGNPYLHWILTGRHGAALPYALRAENFAAIQANLDPLNGAANLSKAS